MFDLRDRDGWMGISADSLEGARLACETVANEGAYPQPFSVYPDSSDTPVAFWSHDKGWRVVQGAVPRAA